MRSWSRFAAVGAMMTFLSPGMSGALGSDPVPDCHDETQGHHHGHEGHHGPEVEKAGIPLLTPWVPVGERSRLKNLDISFLDQDGRAGVVGNLIDKPVLVTFFYSRCQNSRKCSMAVTRLGALQRHLAEAGIDGKVRLLAISYEPQFDTPERLNRYAADRGLRLGENALALQLDTARNQQLVDELQAPVNYNAGWVNAHGVELSLLDANGRLVRKYHTVLWDNDQVAKDLKDVLTGR